MTDSANNHQPFQLPVLSLIKEKQLQHGLRHGDYQRYQQYVTRKLHRLRKSLHFPQGDRRRVLPKTVTCQIAAKDVRYLQIKLFQVERAWARSHQLKSETNAETRKRFHQASRLRKAVKHANELLTLALTNVNDNEQQPLCDARSKLEIQAYCTYLQGLQQFEMESWHKAKELLETSQNIYRGLAEAVDEDEKVIYLSRVDELTPQIRYSAYNIGDQQAVLDLRAMRNDAGGQIEGSSASVELDQLLTQARANQAQAVIEVTWLPNLIVSVRNEKARLAVLAAQDAIADLQESSTPVKNKVAIYESIMKSSVEAMTSVRDEIRLDPNQKNVPSLTVTVGQNLAPENLSRLQLLYMYLAYVKLTHTLDRNLALIQLANNSTNAKPQEFARLYDTVAQTLQELAQMPGIHQHAPTLEDVQSRLLAYRAWRCYYLAQTYLQVKKFIEAGALFKRVFTRYTKEAIEALASIENNTQSRLKLHSSEATVSSLIKSMEELNRQAEADELACRASHVLSLVDGDKLAGAGGVDSQNDLDQELIKKKPLEERLDVFIEDASLLLGKNANLLQIPPEFEPVCAKPIFFDLALNYVKYPSLEDKIPTTKKSTTNSAGASGGAAGGGGLMGWLWGSRK